MRLHVRGIQYHFEWHNSDEGLPTLVLLHGFLGSGEIFKSLIKHCTSFCNPVTIDLLGHGKTEGAELHYRFSTNEQIADITKLVQEQLPAPVFLYGYSMGARLALNIAVQHPHLVQGLILESGTFGIEVDAERQARQALDGSRADQIMGNYNHFLQQWRTLDIFKYGKENNDLENIQHEQNPYWMANALLGFGTGTMPCVREQLNSVSSPTMLITGEFDSKFIGINQVMKKELQEAELVILPESGHRVHSTAHFEIAEHLKLFIENHSL